MKLLLQKKILLIFLILGVSLGYSQGIETFSNVPTNSPTSYNTRNWIGDNGSDWEATNSRTSAATFNASGQGIGLNDDTANTYVESGTISGGVGEITLTVKQIFSGTGSGSVTVSINGSSVGTVPYDDSEAGITTTIPNINISGDFIIRIDNNINGNSGGGDNRVAIDNISWTSGTAPEEPIITNIVQTPASTMVTSSDNVSVSADVTDNSNVVSVTLNWGTTSGMLTNSINMTAPIMSDTYTTVQDIPAQADGTSVYYEIVATDDNLPTANTNTSAELSYTVEDPLILNSALNQNFDGAMPSWSYSSDIPFFGDTGSTGYLGVFDTSEIDDIDSFCLMNNILAENDLDSPNGTTGEAIITFEEVDITANTGVVLSFDYQAVGYNANADDIDYILVLDGVAGPRVSIHDGGVDPDDSLDSIIVSIPDAVNTVALQIIIENNGSSGYSGFDNFRLVDDTAPEQFKYTSVDGWMPRSPDDAVSPATAGSNIKVLSGTPTVAGNFDALDIAVAEGATFTTQGDVNLNGDLIISGTANFNNLQLVGVEGHDFLSTSDIGEINVNILTLENGSSQSLEISPDLSSMRLLAGLIPNDGVITTNDNFIFSSTDGQTAVIGQTLPGSIVGEVTVERYIPQGIRSFRLLTAPVNGGTIQEQWQEGVNNSDVGIANNINPSPTYGTHITGGSTQVLTATAAEAAAAGFDVTSTNNPSMYTVNEQATVATYEAVTTTSNQMTIGEGYLVLIRGDRSTDLSTNNPDHTATTLRATGTLELGDHTFTDLNPGNDNLLTGNGSSLIGNPYQAAVNMEKALDNSTGIEQEFYHIFDSSIGSRGAFVTVMFGEVLDGSADTINYTFDSDAGNEDDPAVTAATRFLQPGQAAFINSQFPSTPEFTITQADKVGLTQINDGTFFTDNSSNSLQVLEASRINVALFKSETLANNGRPIDAFTVRFGNDYSNNLDGFDAKKAFNIDENMATIVEEKQVSIQSRFIPSEADEIPISISNYRSSEYTLRAVVTGLNNATPYLFDNYLGTLTELTSGETTYISFVVDGNDDSSDVDRFKIIFQEQVLNTNDVSNNSFNLYPNPVKNGILYIENSNELVLANEVSIYNLIGQQVYSKTFNVNTKKSVIDVSNLENGIYTVKLSNGISNLTSKIIINKK